ncbi:NAD-dependent succinate-semialdehyde dehydrogenase [Halobium salinum]|uniref:NAD-dependent succinate-semialdehyde dehydrogenase n=1 Tax=Halobium salinum TaxID=1364940 RepID=A0ABD5PGN8_9EURY|nr:NAD-dependent succinate-semialdehyde dehydrogenase [Halobium salinum]
MVESVNPATGETVESYEDHTEEEALDALDAAVDTFEEWRETTFAHRQSLLENAADVLRERQDEYAELMTREMGKPIEQARAEIEKCAWVCEYYAETAESHLAEEQLSVGPTDSAVVRYEPLGPVLAVMPWNFPFWQVFRFAAPNLAAGNVGLLKHSSNSPGSGQAIEEVFREAGFPEGAFQNLFVGSEVASTLIADDRLRAVTLTGSVGAGQAVAEQAGANLKKTVLELGGSDPFVVLDDAPVEETAAKAAHARLQNGGQSCIAAKRFIVHTDVYDEFVDAFVEEMDSWTVGDPLEEETQVGPQADAELMEELHDQVQRTLDEGAEALLGGEPLDREGAYYPPTVLTNVPRDAAAACEETFGPVAAVFEVESEDEAAELANDSEFGLGASVWTGDPAGRGRAFAKRFEAGCCFVNEYVKSDPRVPFGGVKDSGYGRELSKAGIREFVNRKTLWVNHDLTEGSE